MWSVRRMSTPSCHRTTQRWLWLYVVSSVLLVASCTSGGDGESPIGPPVAELEEAPSGGAEQDAVDVRGAFRSTIPLDVPAYRGLEPDLSVSYTSQTGSGWLGVGWTLEVVLSARCEVQRGAGSGGIRPPQAVSRQAVGRCAMHEHERWPFATPGVGDLGAIERRNPGNGRLPGPTHLDPVPTIVTLSFSGEAILPADRIGAYWGTQDADLRRAADRL
jgi:hypothetical protein